MTIITGAPDLTDVLLAELVDEGPAEVELEKDDTWLRRAVDRIRDEAASVSADAAVAAFNSNI